MDNYRKEEDSNTEKDSIKKSSPPHFDIDPAGEYHASNSHIYASETATFIDPVLKNAGIILSVTTAAIGACRLYSALEADKDFDNQADKIITELEKVKKMMESTSSIKCIEHFNEVIELVKSRKTVPAHSIKTASSVAGKLTGGALLGSGGGVLGEAMGDYIGRYWSPKFAKIGSIFGAFVGSIIGSMVGGTAGIYVFQGLADAAIKKQIGFDVSDFAVEVITELENAQRILSALLLDLGSTDDEQNIKATIEYLTKVINQVKESNTVPGEFVETVFSF